MTAGVYAIRNTANGRMYVGSAINIARRWRTHRTTLHTGTAAKAIQADWNCYGPGAFTLVILEKIDFPARGVLAAAEERWLYQLRTSEGVSTYNVHKRVWRPDDRDGMVKRCPAYPSNERSPRSTST